MSLETSNIQTKFNMEYRKYIITDTLADNEKQRLEKIHETYRNQRTRITYSFNN